MPLYTVDIKAFINVEVEAESADQAKAAAEAWIEWISPTDEQLADYLTDHENAGITDGGVLSIDGDSEVEEA